MEVKYERSFSTRISEYQVKLEEVKSGRKKVSLQRFISSKNGESPSEFLNVHPDILLDLIEALEDCRNLLRIEPRKPEIKVSEARQEEIQRRYLRGVSLKDLCIQFNMHQSTVEKVLVDRGIEIVSPKLSMPYKVYKSYGKRRFSR